MVSTTLVAAPVSALSLDERLDGAGKGMMYTVFDLVVSTFFFGVYTVLVWFATRNLLERKLTTRVNKAMFGIITFMYLLSAGYWAFSVAYGADTSRSFISLAKNPLQIQPDHTEVTKWSPLFNAITLLNYVLSDGIVVWRAWIICRRDHRKYLWITIFFLILTAITVFLTIIFRVIGLVQSPIANLPLHSVLHRGIDILQISTVGTSLLSNLAATGAVGATAWGHWRTIRAAFSESQARSFRTNRIMLLVVESGVVYCLSAIVFLLSSLIRLPAATMGDLCAPVGVQIAGAYPTIVILLVSNTRSLSESSFVQGDDRYTSQPIRFNVTVGSASTPNQPQQIQFASNPVLSSGSMMETLDISPEKGQQLQNQLSDESNV
ncbi:hypothetical protein C8R46DRAFT_1340793 [Mycena filopes]|nr:hypothetical protein C8R46DRAFT_1340793 [Mycena filopes]